MISESITYLRNSDEVVKTVPMVGLVCLLAVVLAMAGAIKGYQRGYRIPPDSEERLTNRERSS
jgi:hypothetical protein